MYLQSGSPSATANFASSRPVRVSHGKAADFQARGAVHFHALLRLDGIDPADVEVVVPPRPQSPLQTWTTPSSTRHTPPVHHRPTPAS